MFRPGRPVTGKPPFSWEDTATDALTFNGFTSLYAKARNGTKLSLEATITPGTSSFGARVPEAKPEPKGTQEAERSGDYSRVCVRWNQGNGC